LENAATVTSAQGILDDEATCRLGVTPGGQPAPNPINSPFCQQIIGFVNRQIAPGTTLDQRIAFANTPFINTAKAETSGVDATLAYDLDTASLGRFNFDLGYSIVLTDKFAQNPEDELVDFRDVITYRIQRSRVRGSVGWTKGDWTTTVFGTRFGSVGNAAANRRLPPSMVYNLSVGYRFNEDLGFNLVVNNVLNNTIREDDTQTGYPFYNAFTGQDPAGRSVFFQASYSF
jgi:outer membrane receptor protein involved in Fe transport